MRLPYEHCSPQTYQRHGANHHVRRVAPHPPRVQEQRAYFDQVSNLVAAPVDTNSVMQAPWYPGGDPRRHARCTMLALCAAAEARRHGGLSMCAYNPRCRRSMMANGYQSTKQPSKTQVSPWAQACLAPATWHRRACCWCVGIAPYQIFTTYHSIVCRQAEGKLRRLSPFFIPRVLLNMPAGVVSMTYVSI